MGRPTVRRRPGRGPSIEALCYPGPIEVQQPDSPPDSAPSTATGGLAKGDTIADRYVVEHAIGSGGMGEVVAARPIDGGQRVAVKVMLSRDGDDEGLSRRFLREARTIAAIDSPHVARLIDTGSLDDGRPFLVLELLEGEGLEEVIRQRAPLPIDEAVGLVLQACEGVAEAHARGIVHRDLKPSNLFCCRTDEREPLVKVLDFGIAKPTLGLGMDSVETSLTKSDSLLGSPQYMSPEQIRSAREVDGRTDIWALGVILFKLLTGKLAFDARTVGEHFAMVLSDQPTTLRRLRPEAPAELEEIILQCLEKTPRFRYGDVAALAIALAPFGPQGSNGRAGRIAQVIEGARASLPSLGGLGGALASDDELTAMEERTESQTVAEARTAEVASAERRARTEVASAEEVSAEAPTLVDESADRDRQSSPPATDSGPELSEPSGLEHQDDPLSTEKRSRRWLGAVLFAAVVVGGVWVAARGGVEPAGGADPVDTEGPTAASAASAAGSVGAPPLPTSIQLRLEVTPPEARVELDGRSVTHDAPIVLPYAEAEHDLVVSAPGFVRSKHTFAADRDRYLEVVLDELPVASATPAPPRWPAPP
ncbi:MAG: protein kinase, partial [Deltaproteobacteria bacterium]|nr:protein kinase [Deltaproteobacteria bacterium]